MFSSSLLVGGLIFITQGFTDSLVKTEKIPTDTTVTQVLLQENLKKAFICGGALFHPNYVITATKCVFTYRLDPRRLKVFLTSAYDEKYSYTITEIIIHPEYLPKLEWFDIALIKLSSPILEHSGKIYGIMPTPDEHIKNERPVTVFSFGRGTVFNRVNLLHNKLNIVGQKICNSEYERFGCHITEVYVCARNTSLGSCVGSAGFPLVDTRNRIIGIATFPFICGPLLKSGLPTVYSRVSTYLFWINQTVSGSLTTSKN
ncbi:serine protease 28-like isoform X2 [Pseudomyrmex gracilis]|nr:serine protease 28-like isoform X2 [Pseudomyrmex gracilis]XP_020296393.1 serine protease 28-like isoform X2 [Pseudomyrmex gracilis]XP_020296399.1 serine protease 28-like isoform X2 [Pseudomyrmex gracilis]